MAIIEQWHIRSRAHHCAGSGEAFAEGQEIVAALFPDEESSGYLRRDFSLAAWALAADSPEKPFSTWRSVYHPPVTEEKPDMVKKESAEELLRRLAEEDDEHTENARYILAVMLERKKLLRETDTQPTPNGILRIYEHRRDGDVFIIRDPNIPLDQIESVQQDIIDLLENSGRPPLPAAESPESSIKPADAGEVSPNLSITQ
jgi:hypothetical protein